jgi:tetratricopeptide (TPR) repeat protein
MPAEQALILSNMAQVHLYRRDWAEAQACLNRSQALFAEAGSREFLAELERRWGEFYLKTGQLDQALAHLGHSLELAVEQGNPLEEGLSQRVLGQVYLAQGDIAAATAALQQSRQILAELNRYEAAKTGLALAHLALTSGSPAEARAPLAQARNTFAALGAQADLAEAEALARRL